MATMSRLMKGTVTYASKRPANSDAKGSDLSEINMNMFLIG